MTPGDYGTMFTEEIRASGAVEELLAGIFPDGKRIESADEIHEVTETFFDEWQVQTPVLFAEMLLWDLKCVVMKAANPDLLYMTSPYWQPLHNDDRHNVSHTM